jgi:hypothetical protein
MENVNDKWSYICTSDFANYLNAFFLIFGTTIDSASYLQMQRR